MAKRNHWGNNRDRRELNDNVDSFIKYRDHLMELGMSMIGWDFSKIDREQRQYLNERQIEYNEYFKGATVFFKDEELNAYLCLPVILAPPFDVNDIPMRRTAYSKNGYRKELSQDNSVVIYNNYLRKPTCYTVNHYAERLADLENAIDVNCKAQKTPVIILCNENERLSMLQLYNKYDGNQPFIFGEKDLNVNGVRAINTGAPFIADKMYQMKMQIWNEALTHLGISNISYQKKERLVSDEVIRNMGGTIASRQSRLQTRIDAVTKIKDMFGVEIDVYYKEDYRQPVDEYMGEQNNSDEFTYNKMVRDIRSR